MPIHTKPSINCCVANKNGIAAKYFWDGFFTYFMPTAPTVMPTIKLLLKIISFTKLIEIKCTHQFLIPNNYCIFRKQF